MQSKQSLIVALSTIIVIGISILVASSSSPAFVAASCPALSSSYASSLCTQTSGASVNKYGTDFVNNMLTNGGFSSTGERGAAALVSVLSQNGWTSATYSSSSGCADGTILYYAQGSCSDFSSSSNVAVCFNNKRYQWSPSRCDRGVSWGSCIPKVYTKPSCATPAPPTPAPPTPVPPTAAPPTPAPTPAPPTSCNPGYYLKNSQCTSCDRGYKCSDGVSRTGCSQGYYQDSYGQTTCKQCGCGKYSFYADTTCWYCSSGQYATAGSSSCSTCPSGQEPTSTKCGCQNIPTPAPTPAPPTPAPTPAPPTQCPTGQYLANSQCNTCSAGYKCADGKVRVACSYGNYQDRTGQSSCKQCSCGERSGYAASSCTSCSSSQYATAGSSSCSTCASGKRPTNDFCGCEDIPTPAPPTPAPPTPAPTTPAPPTQCQIGQYISNGYCIVCEAGYKCANGRTRTSCANGYYQDRTGQSSCKSCACGYRTGYMPASQCYACSSGQYSTAGSANCYSCPSGKELTSDKCGCQSIVTVSPPTAAPPTPAPPTPAPPTPAPPTPAPSSCSPLSKATAMSKCQETSGASVDKYPADFVNQLLTDAGLQSTNSRVSDTVASTLKSRGWTQTTYSGSCPDGSILYYKVGECGSFTSSSYVSVCFDNSRYAWANSRCGAAVTWTSGSTTCTPYVLTRPCQATPAPPTPVPPTPAPPTPAPPTPAPTPAPPTQCPTGQYLSNSQCSMCPVGYKCADGVSRSACSNGYYQDRNGQSSCKQCSCGQYSSSGSASSMCQMCSSSQYSPAGSSSCSFCGSGKEPSSNKCGCQNVVTPAPPTPAPPTPAPPTPVPPTPAPPSGNPCPTLSKSSAQSWCQESSGSSISGKTNTDFVNNLLTSAGYPSPNTLNADTFASNLQNSGWTKTTYSGSCPDGSILYYKAGQCASFQSTSYIAACFNNKRYAWANSRCGYSITWTSSGTTCTPEVLSKPSSCDFTPAPPTPAPTPAPWTPAPPAPPGTTAFTTTQPAALCKPPALNSNTAKAVDIAAPLLSLPNDWMNQPNVARVRRIINESYFTYLFPYANLGKGPSPGNGPYTYNSFLEAIARFPHLCDDEAVTSRQRGYMPDKDTVCKVELATMFAHFGQESGRGCGSCSVPRYRQALYHYEEVACIKNPPASRCPYTKTSGWPAQYFPGVSGQRYYGRGPFQLTWNYHYGWLSSIFYGSSRPLLENPGLLVSKDPTYSFLAIASAIWFYMLPAYPKPSMHDVVTGNYQNLDSSKGPTSGFAATVWIINGGECSYSYDYGRRIEYYNDWCQEFGVTGACNYGAKSCKKPNTGNFQTSAFASPSMYWQPGSSSSCSCSIVKYQTAFLASINPVYDGYTQCVSSISSYCGRTCGSKGTIPPEGWTPAPPTPAPTPVPTTPAPPGACPSLSAAKAKSWCQQTSGSSVGKTNSDFVNNLLVDAGYPSTNSQVADTVASTLKNRGWTETTYSGSCPDGSVLYYKAGQCASFQSTSYVAACFDNKRYAWSNSRCGYSITWTSSGTTCIPKVLTKPGYCGQVTPAPPTPAPPTPAPPTPAPPTPAPPTPAPPTPSPPTSSTCPALSKSNAQSWCQQTSGSSVGKYNTDFVDKLLTSAGYASPNTQNADTFSSSLENSGWSKSRYSGSCPDGSILYYKAGECNSFRYTSYMAACFDNKRYAWANSRCGYSITWTSSGTTCTPYVLRKPAACAPPTPAPPTTRAPPASNGGTCYDHPKAKEALLRLAAEVSGGVQYDKWCTDLTEKVMVAGGLPATRDRRAKEQAEILRARGWKSKSWDGSAPDFSVLFWAQGSCSSFMGNNHVAIVYKNKRYQWNPSRSGSVVKWADCNPEVLMWPGCVNEIPGEAAQAPAAETQPPLDQPVLLSFNTTISSASLATSNLLSDSLHTAVVQDVARVLNVPISKVEVNLVSDANSVSEGVNIQITVKDIKNETEKEEINGLFEFVVERDEEVSWLADTSNVLRDEGKDPFFTFMSATEETKPDPSAPSSNNNPAPNNNNNNNEDQNPVVKFCLEDSPRCLGLGIGAGFLLISLVVFVIWRKRKNSSGGGLRSSQAGRIGTVAADDYHGVIGSGVYEFAAPPSDGETATSQHQQPPRQRSYSQHRDFKFNNLVENELELSEFSKSQL